MKKSTKKCLQGLLPAFLLWMAPMASSVRTISKFRTKAAVIKRIASNDALETNLYEHKRIDQKNPFEIFGECNKTESSVDEDKTSDILNFLKKEDLLTFKETKKNAVYGDLTGRKNFAAAVCYYTPMSYVVSSITKEEDCNGAGQEWRTIVPSIESSSVSDITSSSFKLNVDVSHSATVYAVAALRTTTAPTSTHVKNGQDGTGAAAISTGSTVLSTANFSGSITLNAANSDQNIYNVYCIAEDADGMTATPKVHNVLSPTSYTSTTLITYSNNENAYPDLEIDNNNNLYVMYQKLSDTTSNDYKFGISKWNGTAWDLYTELTDDAVNGINMKMQSSDMVIDSNGHIHVIANIKLSQSEYKIYHNKYDGSSWSGFTEIYTSIIDESPIVEYVVADNSNYLHIIFRNRSNNKLCYSNNLNGWTTIEIDSLPWASIYRWPVVESNRTVHFFYRKEGKAYTTNSTDNFAEKTEISDSVLMNVAIDSNDKIHLLFTYVTPSYNTNSPSGDWGTEESIPMNGLKTVTPYCIKVDGSTPYIFLRLSDLPYSFFMRKVNDTWEEGNFFLSGNTYTFYIDKINNKIHFFGQLYQGQPLQHYYLTTTELFETASNSGSLTSITWTGSTDSDWTKGNNWNEAQGPTSGIDIIIQNASNQPILGQSMKIKDLTLQSSSALTINEAHTLTVANLEIDNDAVISISNSAGVLLVTGTYNQVGTGKIDATNGGQANIQGNISKNGTERLLIDSSTDGVIIKSSIILRD